MIHVFISANLFGLITGTVFFSVVPNTYNMNLAGNKGQETFDI